MIVKNIALLDKEGFWDMKIENGKIKDIVKSSENNYLEEKEEVIQGDGNLLISPFVEPHIHLDTTLTAGEPRWNLSGTLFEGIECWSERKTMLNKEDIKKRAKKAIEWQIANGIQYIRTHVDITDPTLMGLEALIEVREEMKNYVTIQLVAFPQEGILSYPKGEELMEKAIEMGADVIGCIPHFEHQRDWGVESIKKVIELGVKYNKLIDVHCDEIDDEQSRFLEVLAAEAWKVGIGHKVTASHTTAMGSYNDAYAYKLFRTLKHSGINFVANPLVNIHLGGRFDTYPKRRGLTRVKELLEGGINVCFGHDDICDPWYPLGNGNMLQVVHMGLHVSHMMGYEEIKNALRLVTTNSAKTLCLNDYGIEIGNSANFIILSEKDPYNAIRLQGKVLYSVRNGKIIAKTNKPQTEIYLEVKKEVNFK